MNNVIEIKKLTKDYGSGRGIFDIDLDIARGEMVGFAGTNGSGKTTTIRHIMGFIQPTKGAACVNGLEAWQHSSEYVREIGYVPGEIAFPDLSTGTIFLKSQADFLNLKDLSYAQELIEHLQLDPGALLRRMSKGMKQKTAIVAALMADPAIIILDEPTTGLDPLMRDAFLEIWHSFGYDQASASDASSLSYLYKTDDRHWFLMLDSAIYEPETLVEGRIKGETLLWMEEILKEAEEQHAQVIPVAHHNLLYESRLYRTMCTLNNWQEVTELLERYRVPVWFSGHLHLQRIRSYLPEPGAGP